MQAKIIKRNVDAARPKERDWFMWDTELKGFGLKVTRSGNRIYIVQYRMSGRGVPTRRLTIGKHGSPWTPEKAREEAKRVLGEIADGQDPQQVKMADKAAMTVSELCERYLEEGCATKKPSTIATDKGRIERHIKPLLGRQRVKDLTVNDIKRFMADIAKGKTAADERTGPHGRARVVGGKGTATRTVGLLGGILSFAVAEGVRSDNPARGVKRFPDRKNERFLNSHELARLGEVLRTAGEAEKERVNLERTLSSTKLETERAALRDRISTLAKGGENEMAIAAIRMLILTGCRKTEILSLKWHEVDFEFGCLRLDDSKTGQKTIMLGAPALQLLAGLSRDEKSPYVFPALRGEGHYVGLPKVWIRIRERAGLHDVRLHDLRHTFASAGAGSGIGLQVLGKLLGHSDPKTTSRYAHIANDPIKAAADRTAGRLADAMNERDSSRAEVIDLVKNK
ncbi:site-specific integrase [Sneathiella litorea]|uniref:Tyrosine-type recombinase/integrase n=1 Tax=Sneathiella litorea TaxID=2606216 RepID=A0A6L8W3K5_9PROT|nr:site-specific integrase [Sneathiella litorea]MZR29631.1 tyrosine-type recombinase/integrase [Sneathiella litorea]